MAMLWRVVSTPNPMPMSSAAREIPVLAWYRSTVGGVVFGSTTVREKVSSEKEGVIIQWACCV